LIGPLQTLTQGRRQVKNMGWTHMASAERDPITWVWGAPSGTPSGVQGQIPCSGGQQGQSPLTLKNFSFWMPNGSSKFALFSAFCKLPKPRGYMWCIHLSKTDGIVHVGMDNTVSTDRLFGIAVLVMCEVALQSKSAQIVAPDLTGKPHWTTTV